MSTFYPHQSSATEGRGAATIPEFLARMSGGDVPNTAVAAGRCLLPPIGCGQRLTVGDLTEVAAREWRISGLCPTCSDWTCGDAA